MTKSAQLKIHLLAFSELLTAPHGLRQPMELAQMSCVSLASDMNGLFTVVVFLYNKGLLAHFGCAHLTSKLSGLDNLAKQSNHLTAHFWPLSDLLLFSQIEAIICNLVSTML